MRYVSNVFTLGMLKDVAIAGIDVRITPVSVEEARTWLVGRPMRPVEPWSSAVGHADHAALMSSIVDVEIPANRVAVSLVAGDELLVGQYDGPRLAEGAHALPEGATLRWFTVWWPGAPRTPIDSYRGERVAGRTTGSVTIADVIVGDIPDDMADCPSCDGYGYFDEETGRSTIDRRGRKCLDCRGEGKR